MGRVDRAIGSTMPSTAKVSPIGIKGRRKNSTGQAPTTRLSHGSSFADARSKEDRISGAVEPVIAVDLAGKAGLAIAAEPVIVAVSAGKAVLVAVEALADKVELAIVVARVVRASWVVVEVAAAHLKASIAEVAAHAAPASAAAPAWEVLGVVLVAAVAEEPEVVEVAEPEVEAVADAADNYD